MRSDWSKERTKNPKLPDLSNAHPRKSASHLGIWDMQELSSRSVLDDTINEYCAFCYAKRSKLLIADNAAEASTAARSDNVPIETIIISGIFARLALENVASIGR